MRRDLDELIVQEGAEITNPGRKPLRYRSSDHYRPRGSTIRRAL